MGFIIISPCVELFSVPILCKMLETLDQICVNVNDLLNEEERSHSHALPSSRSHALRGNA